MAFSKKKVDDRKQWLQGFAPGTFLDHTAETISYSEFVHKVRDPRAASQAVFQGRRRPVAPPSSA